MSVVFERATLLDCTGRDPQPNSRVVVDEGLPPVPLASKLATRELEGLGDKGVPLEEQDRRKRVLVKGPKEFRDARADQPKKNERR